MSYVIMMFDHRTVPWAVEDTARIDTVFVRQTTSSAFPPPTQAASFCYLIPSGGVLDCFKYYPFDTSGGLLLYLPVHEALLIITVGERWRRSPQVIAVESPHHSALNPYPSGFRGSRRIHSIAWWCILSRMVGDSAYTSCLVLT